MPSVEIGPSTGGSLSIENDNGDILIIEFKPYALFEPVTFSAIWVDNSIEYQFNNIILHKVKCEISPYLHYSPALVTCIFSDPLIDLNNACFFRVCNDGKLVPLISFQDGNTLLTDVTEFSEIFIGIPTPGEVENNFDDISITIPDDQLDLQNFLDAYEGMTGWLGLIEMFGNYPLAGEWRQRMMDRSISLADEILTSELPIDPCKEYFYRIQKIIISFQSQIMPMFDAYDSVRESNDLVGLTAENEDEVIGGIFDEHFHFPDSYEKYTELSNRIVKLQKLRDEISEICPPREVYSASLILEQVLENEYPLSVASEPAYVNGHASGELRLGIDNHLRGKIVGTWNIYQPECEYSYAPVYSASECHSDAYDSGPMDFEIKIEGRIKSLNQTHLRLMRDWEDTFYFTYDVIVHYLLTGEDNWQTGMIKRRLNPWCLDLLNVKNPLIGRHVQEKQYLRNTMKVTLDIAQL